MSKTKQLITTTNLVKTILEENPQARNSDSYLYLKVLENISAQKGIDLSGLTVPNFLTSINVLGLPCFETVRRSRQKIQSEYPELAANKTVQGYRTENELEYVGYARSEV
jgi:hypothetical protein